MMMTVGLTGPTGAGKSLAGKAAAELGFEVIDCDKVAHDVLNCDTECQTALANAFGSDILENSKINRKRLAEKAFADKNSTALLNKTALPFIVKEIKKRQSGKRVLLDAPTLFQSGMDAECDVTIGVLSDADIRLARILARDDIDESAARLRMQAGERDEFYIENCDYLVYNNGEEQEFCRVFKDLLANILEGRK